MGVGAKSMGGGGDICFCFKNKHLVPLDYHDEAFENGTKRTVDVIHA